jgi:pimeloyl-ACP methyl ester carboxylesterase
MKRFFGWLFIILSLTLLVGPFLVPVPELEDTVTVVELADTDSRFIDVEDISVHYKQAGSDTPAFLLLHGFGASTFTWREVMDDFSALGRTVAYDRTAFGLTGRPLDFEGDNPYGAQAQISQAIGLMDALDIDRVVLVGNSAGGTTAANIAVVRPERVQALVLVSPAIGMGGGRLRWLQPLLHTPQMDHLGPWLARRITTSGSELMQRAWHDPSLLTPAIIEGYRLPLKAHDWDRALWEFSRAPRTDSQGRGNLADRLGELATIPTLVITGDDDRVVPVSVSRSVAEKIPGSRYVELPTCGHVPQEECPAAFFAEVETFLRDSDVLVEEAPVEAPIVVEMPEEPI